MTDASNVPIEVFTDDTAVSSADIGIIVVIIRVAPITGAIVPIVVVTPPGANADPYADRSCTDPKSLRPGRRNHRGRRNSRRSHNSYRNFPHWFLHFEPLLTETRGRA